MDSTQNYEQILFDEGLPLRVKVGQLDHFRLHWHYHPELLFVVSGAVNIYLGGQSYLLHERQMMYIDSTDLHGLDALRDGCLLLSVQFDADFFCRLPEMRDMHFRHDAFMAVQERAPGDLAELTTLFSRIVRMYIKRPRGYCCQIVSAMFAILALLVRLEYFVPDAPEDREQQNIPYQRIKDILEYISANSEQELSLKEIARQKHISYYYLSSMFRRATGMTFREHLNSIRLYKSLQALRGGKDSLEMIAAQYGFSNARAYSTVFARRYGMTPSEYRALCQRPQRGGSDAGPLDEINGFGSIYDMLETCEVQDGDGRQWFEEVSLSVDAAQAGIRPLRHVWQNILTCGRASDLLRSDIRDLLRRAQREVGFRYLRFHGLFCDDMMILVPGRNGETAYNWAYVDQALDLMLEIGLRPFLELSFMPSELASGDATVFWYRANITPPRDMNAWAALVSALIRHCVERYGEEEVSQWYAEVWSQPDYGGSFWTGTMEEYFHLYEASARAVKAVCPGMKVGGPAITSINYEETPWMREFFLYCKKHDVPVDFASAHIYTDSRYYELRGGLNFPPIAYKPAMRRDREEAVPREHLKVIARTGMQVDEFHVTEWAPTPRQSFTVRDTAFMGPFVVHGALHCEPRVTSLAFWTLCDLNDEVKKAQRFFQGGMGMFNYKGVPKPSYLAFQLLRRLGDTVLSEGENYIVTRRGEEIQALVYNIAYLDHLAQANTDFTSDYEGDVYTLFEDKPTLRLQLEVRCPDAGYRLSRYELDREHGSAYDRWVEMHSPREPEKADVDYLLEAAALQRSVSYVRAQEGKLMLECAVPAHGCCLLVLSPVSDAPAQKGGGV